MPAQSTIPVQEADPAALPLPLRRRSVTPRAVLLGVLLLPVNAYWVICMELMRYSAHPTTLSLFFNCVFLLVVLTLLNVLVARILPRWALCQGELLLVYSMLGIGTAMCGHDLLQILPPMLAWPVYKTSSENHWDQLFAGAYPKWLTLTDYGAARDFFIGNSTLYTVSHLRAWAVPALTWCAFLLTLLFVLQCVNAILRKHWTDSERLTYPLVRLPLEITAQAPGGPGGTPLTRQRLFWGGFVLAAVVDTVNALNYYYPAVPSILTPGNGQSFLDLHQFVSARPWNAIGWTPLSFYPFVIGLGMLMPMDFLFSIWFFYLFWKLQSVLVVGFAWDADPRMPYANYQSGGAYFLFCVSSVWLARGFLKQAWRRALGLPSTVDDRDEPLRYRAAFAGIGGGLVLLVGFSVYLGLAWWLAVLFFFLYLCLALAITRMLPLAPQVEEAVAQPDVLGELLLARDLHRQHVGTRLHHDILGAQLDRAGRQPRVHGRRIARHHRAGHRDHALGPHRVNGYEGLRSGGEDALRHAVMVAQVDEQQAAVVALAVHPARQAGRLASVAGAERAAGVGAVGVHWRYPEARRAGRQAAASGFVKRQPALRRAAAARSLRANRKDLGTNRRPAGFMEGGRA